MNLAWTLITGWVVMTSLAGFVMMGVDKFRARGHSRRISERSFFGLAAVGGAFGIILGSSVFHHKTLKDSFTLVILLAAILWVVILAGLVNLIGPPFF